MAEFEALIKGRAELKDAKSAFDSFKQQIENNTIKLKFDLSGLSVQFNNLQRQFNQQGSQAGQYFINGFRKNLDNVTINSSAFDSLIRGFYSSTGKSQKSVLSELGADHSAFVDLERQLDNIVAKGTQLSKLKFDKFGRNFTANATGEMGQLITLTGRWRDAIKDANGQVVKEAGWDIQQNTIIDFTENIKKSQQEAEKLSTELKKVTESFSNGDFSAKTATMSKELSEVSDTVNDNLVQKAKTAADEYKRITDQIATSLQNPNASNALQGQALVDAFRDAEGAAKRYDNAMKEVHADTTKMFADGENFRRANEVESWAKKNSKALEKYGAQLEQLKQQMRNASSAGELKDLQNQFKNLKAEANALGLTGLSFGDQFKRAFSRIAEFTGIYAFTTKVRQALVQMPKEVIKIDTAMTELRKVSTATATELSNYFETAADSANKYGQSIDKIIDSTASWTRLGYNLNDASILTDVTAELAQVGSGLNTETATEGLQATIRGFGLAADEAKRVGDMINYIADTQPIDALGIINGLERSSAVLRETNNTLEESIGLITATTSVTQDATSAGTAWRTKFKERNCANVQKCA